MQKPLLEEYPKKILNMQNTAQNPIGFDFFIERPKGGKQ